MYPQTVKIALFDQERTPFPITDEWKFAAKHKWQWVRRLQVLAFDWLVKQGAQTNVIGQKLTYTRVVLSEDSPTIDSIREVLLYMMRDYNVRPGHLYVSHDMAEQMMYNRHDSNMMQVMSFTHGYPREIMGIPWTVVPWMDGWVIVPEDK